MKPRFTSSLTAFAASSIFLTWFVTPANAATLTWDTTTDDGPAVTAGSGGWNLTAGNAVWNDGATPNVIWSQASTTDGSNIATFAGADGSVDQYVITLGAQMAAFNPQAEVGLAEHLQNGEVGEAYPDRLVVIPGATPFTCTRSGDLPAGLAFDEVTGILSGTPTAAGEFSFTIEAADEEEAENGLLLTGLDLTGQPSGHRLHLVRPD